MYNKFPYFPEKKKRKKKYLKSVVSNQLKINRNKLTITFYWQ